MKKKIAWMGLVIGILCGVSGMRAQAEDPGANSWRFNNGQLKNQLEEQKETGEGGMMTMGTYSTGIDVSKWNGTINWAKVKASGKADFAIIRCRTYTTKTKTSTIDAQFARNIKGCVDNHIPFGVYIYSYAKNTSTALWEANYTINALKSAGVTSAMVYFDMEDSSTLSSKKSTSQKNLANYATVFCNQIQAAGYTPGVYANKDWWENYLTYPCFDKWSRWVARYNTTCGYAKPYDIWQYSGKGKISGISGYVDMNYQVSPKVNWGNGITYTSVTTPGKVHGVKAKKRYKSAITVKWSKVSGAKGYAVYRSSSPDGKYKKVKTVTSGSTTSWKNKKLSRGRQYYYKVRAYTNVLGYKRYGQYSDVKRIYTKGYYKKTRKVKKATYIYSAAGTHFSKLTSVKRNKKLTAYYYTKDRKGKVWYRVKVKKGRKTYYGYIKRSYTKAR